MTETPPAPQTTSAKHPSALRSQPLSFRRWAAQCNAARQISMRKPVWPSSRPHPVAQFLGQMNLGVAHAYRDAMSAKGKTTAAVQAILGLILLATGFNKFLQFMAPPDMAQAGSAFMQALMQTGYMMPFIALVEIAVGLMLIAHLWTPLAAVILAPLSLNVLLFHLFLAPDFMFMGLVVALLNLYLIFTYRSKYKPMLSAQ